MLERFKQIAEQTKLSDEDKKYLAQKHFTFDNLEGNFSGLLTVLLTKNLTDDEKTKIFKLACKDKDWMDTQYVIRTESNDTLMHYAALCNCLGVIKILKDCGYNINEIYTIPFINQKTPLDLYIECYDKGINALKKLGAKTAKELLQEKRDLQEKKAKQDLQEKKAKQDLQEKRDLQEKQAAKYYFSFACFTGALGLAICAAHKFANGILKLNEINGTGFFTTTGIPGGGLSSTSMSALNAIANPSYMRFTVGYGFLIAAGAGALISYACHKHWVVAENFYGKE